jgi:acyl carrier protein
VPDQLERDIVEILTRISRRPVVPTLDSTLVADLGFDSLLVLELIGELEDRFQIVIPVNEWAHVRTVTHVVEGVRALAAGQPAEPTE